MITLEDSLRLAEQLAEKHISKDMGDNNDLVQLARIAVWVAWTKTSGNLDPKLINRVSRNAVINEYRRIYRYEGFIRENKDALKRHYTLLMEEDEKENLDELLDYFEMSLFGTQREIFRFLRNAKTIAQIAEDLGLKVSSVRCYISKTIAAARKFGRRRRRG